MQELILIRGLPGSGKSTLAQLMKSFDCYEYMEVSHFETDMYFMKPRLDTISFKEEIEYKDANSGLLRDEFDYVFEAHKIVAAHEWCQNEVRKKLKDTHAIVIVSNTFSRVWEMQPYLNMAREFGAKLTVLTCEGNYGSIHDVPEETIQKMRDRWEPYTG